LGKANVLYTPGPRPKSNTSVNSCPRLLTAGKPVTQNSVKNKRHRRNRPCLANKLNQRRNQPNRPKPKAPKPKAKSQWPKANPNGQRPVLEHRTRPNRSPPARGRQTMAVLQVTHSPSGAQGHDLCAHAATPTFVFLRVLCGKPSPVFSGEQGATL